jgi:hypothetical protein
MVLCAVFIALVVVVVVIVVVVVVVRQCSPCSTIACYGRHCGSDDFALADTIHCGTVERSILRFRFLHDGSLRHNSG